MSSVAESDRDVNTGVTESNVNDCTSVWSAENESTSEVAEAEAEAGCSWNSLLDDTESDFDNLSSLSSLEDSSCSLWEVTRLPDDDDDDGYDGTADDDDDESDSDVSCCVMYHVRTCTVYRVTNTDSYMIVDMVPKC